MVGAQRRRRLRLRLGRCSRTLADAARPDRRRGRRAPRRRRHPRRVPALPGVRRRPRRSAHEGPAGRYAGRPPAAPRASAKRRRGVGHQDRRVVLAAMFTEPSTRRSAVLPRRAGRRARRQGRHRLGRPRSRPASFGAGTFVCAARHGRTTALLGSRAHAADDRREPWGHRRRRDLGEPKKLAPDRVEQSGNGGDAPLGLDRGHADDHGRGHHRHEVLHGRCARSPAAIGVRYCSPDPGARPGFDRRPGLARCAIAAHRDPTRHHQVEARCATHASSPTTPGARPRREHRSAGIQRRRVLAPARERAPYAHQRYATVVDDGATPDPEQHMETENDERYLVISADSHAGLPNERVPGLARPRVPRALRRGPRGAAPAPSWPRRDSSTRSSPTSGTPRTRRDCAAAGMPPVATRSSTPTAWPAR